MLVLTRKIGEQIIIADHIRISIVEVGPGRVKIGIEAPRSVTIDRAEIHDRKLADPELDSHFVEIPKIHDRIAEALFGPDSPRVIPTDTSKPLRLENRLKALRQRLPRKSR